MQKNSIGMGIKRGVSRTRQLNPSLQIISEHLHRIAIGLPAIRSRWINKAVLK